MADIDLSYTIDDVGGTTANKAVVWGATPGATVKMPTAANQKIAGITDGAAVQNAAVGVFAGGGRHKVTVKAASPNIAVDDKLVIHGTSGAFKKAANATITTAGAGTTNKNIFTAANVGRDGNALCVDYRDPGGIDGTLSLVMEGDVLVVNLATDGAASITTKSGDVTTLIAGSAQALELITCANAGDGNGVVTAGFYELTGGDNVDPGYYVIARQAATQDDVDIVANVPIL